MIYESIYGWEAPKDFLISQGKGASRELVVSSLPQPLPDAGSIDNRDQIKHKHQAAVYNTVNQPQSAISRHLLLRAPNQWSVLFNDVLSLTAHELSSKIKSPLVIANEVAKIHSNWSQDSMIIISDGICSLDALCPSPYLRQARSQFTWCFSLDSFPPAFHTTHYNGEIWLR